MSSEGGTYVGDKTSRRLPIVAALLGPFEHMAASRVNYWLGYAVDIAAVLGFAAGGAGAGDALRGAAAVAAGWAGWTLWEYQVHRFAFHRRESPLESSHLVHHAAPRAVNGLPFFVALLIALALFGVLRLFLSTPFACLAVAGAYMGYVHYSILHHVQHATPRSYGPYRRLRRHHMLHHRFIDRNFGVTTTLWDRVFGTYQAAPARAARRREEGC